jgi:hypothetical protein
MHRLSSNFVLGYHGCDARVAEKLLSGAPFKASANDYDWLGSGVYFWESNPQRGLDFAIESSMRKSSSIANPAVVGAVIELGLCLDMTTLLAVRMVRDSYTTLKETLEAAGERLPVNDTDLLRRKLDCAVVQWLHSILESQDVSLDIVRGVFIEGSPIYPNSGFNEKTHTQIAVRNLACIKGVFRVPENQLQRWAPAA